MKCLVKSSLLVAGFFFSSASWGAVDLTFGLNVYHFDYAEDLTAPLKSTEKANVAAPFVTAIVPLTNIGQSFLKFEGEITGSVKSDFDGSTQGGSPVKDTNTLSFARAEGNFYFETMPSFYVYGGLGLRYWNRFLNGGSGYREIYTWNYLPVGFYWQIPMADNLSLGVDLSYRMMFNGKLQVIFSETVVNGDDTELTLGNKPGYKLQVPLKIAMQNNQAITLTPWYEYSQIGSSDVKYNATTSIAGYIQEPPSRTYQYGLAAGFMLTF